MSADNSNNNQWPAPNNDDNVRGEQWPQPGNTNLPEAASSSGGHVTTNCPHCNRKLLSTRSVMCNWCGKRIEDPEYLERAAQERAEQDAKERTEIEQELEVTARVGVRGYLKQQAKNPLRPTVNPLFTNDTLP